ncbi:MAG: GDSL-type esterase/lipase family protein [Elusimicrobia bacterium]|nr:GDSL-type esterase/lipase family protein [Elusimicrobiota bacterium]
MSGRWGLVLAGCAAALLAAEGALWIGGRFVVSRGAAGARDSGVRVLCLGDSFTFGLGAPPGRSYPDALQRLFDAEAPGRVRVINAGIPGANTSMVLESVEENLSRIRPAAVLLLAGCNDNSNFKASNYHLLLGGWAARRARLEAAVSRCRVCRLAIRAWRRWRSGAAPAGPRPSPEVPPAIGSAAWHLRAARELDQQGRGREALAAVRRALTAFPADAGLHALAGHILLHRLADPAGAAAELERARALAPRDQGVLRSLFVAYHRLGDADRTREAVSALARLAPGDAEAARLGRYGVPAYGDVALFRRLVAYDLERIVRACRRAGVRVVLLTYNQDWPDETIARVAGELQTPLADNRGLFNGSPEPLQRYYAPDGHLNADGYALMAGNVHRVLAPLLGIGRPGGTSGLPSPAPSGRSARQ